MDTAFAVEPNQFAERNLFVEVQFLVIDETAFSRTMLHRQILKRTFAALVADGAIERVRSQQEFNRAFLSFLRFCGLREDDHAFGNGIGAGCFEFGHELNLGLAVFHHNLSRCAVEHRAADFNETHAAHADRFEFGMVAEDGDIHTRQLGRVGYQRSIWNGDLFSIYGKCYLF